jgi:hypothetical protein
MGFGNMKLSKIHIDSGMRSFAGKYKQKTYQIDDSGKGNNGIIPFFLFKFKM